MFWKKNTGVIDFGWLELTFAFYPILSGYTYGPVRLDLLVLLILDSIVLFRRREILNYKPLFFLSVFVIFHEIFLCFILDAVPIYHYNAIFSTLISLASIFIIVPALNFKKLVNSLYFVGLISIIGIVYHFIQIRVGAIIHPLKLPFLPDLPSDARIFEEGYRPCSFYWEPAAFVTYMMIPLFLSLNQKKYILSCCIVFSMFLSTSTTGILLSIVMILIYILTQHIQKKYKIILFAISFAMIYLLLNTTLFESGVEKIMNTDIESTSRLINGPRLVDNMPKSHLLFGMLSPNVDDYYNQTSYLGSTYLLLTRSGSIFVSSFWLVLAKYGIIGLFFYLFLYFKVMFSCKKIVPYIMILIISMFSQGVMFSAIFFFQFVFILVFIKQSKLTYERKS